VKARQVLMLVTGAALMTASAVDAQSTNNTQRPLRPGQQRGPAFMVPVFRSSDRALGVQIADITRDRLMSDNLMTSMWVISKKDLEANLQLSGYSGTEALSEGDLKQLAQFIKADQYLDGTVTKAADGSITFTSTLNLPRGEGLSQPLPVFTGAKPGDIAAKLSPELEKARKQVKPSEDCRQSSRARNYDEAKSHAAKAIREYPNSVFGRLCLLEVAISQRAPDDEKIKVAEEILAIAPENDRALEVVVDAYANKAKTDKAYETKYIATLERLLLADPTNTSLQTQVIRALAAASQMQKAKTLVDEAVKQSPGDPELIKLQYAIYRALNDFKGAIAVGEEMVKHDTAAADTMFFQQLVAAYLSDSQPVKAQEAAARGVAKFRNDVTLLLSVVQLARRNGQLPQALEATNRLLAIDPKNTNAALQKAQIYSDMDQVDSMMVALRAAVDLGAPKETAGNMALSKGSPWFQSWNKDSAKTLAEGERILAVLVFADSLSPTPAAALLNGFAYLVTSNMLLTEAREPKSCELATKGRDRVVKAQEVLPRAGRTYPNETAGAMTNVMQLQPYAEQLVRTFCKAPTTPTRPPR
jgi:tetratricopeptide (TPR) repeat protein